MEVGKENICYKLEDVKHERVCKAVQGVSDHNTLNHPVDEFVFAENYKPNQSKLIEVPEEIAEHVLNGGEFYIVGEKYDFLTLCLPGRTFQTKEVEKSNCMVLSNFGEIPKNMNERIHRQFIVNNITYNTVDILEKPAIRTPRFVEILNERGVNIFEEDPIFPLESLTLDQVTISIPMSTEQLTLLLKRYPIFTWRDQFYVLNEEARRHIVESFCNFIDETQKIMGNVEKIKADNIVSSHFLAEIRSIYSMNVAEDLVKWLLFMFCDQNEDNTYKLVPKNICTEMCRIGLKYIASTKFVNLNDFEKSLSVDLPACVNFDESCLAGLAYVKYQTGTEQKMVKYLNSEDLELNVDKRLAQLFTISPSWALNDIEPYFKEFIAPTDTVFKLLSSIARISTKNGQSFVHPLY